MQCFRSECALSRVKVSGRLARVTAGFTKLEVLSRWLRGGEHYLKLLFSAIAGERVRASQLLFFPSISPPNLDYISNSFDFYMV